MAVSGWATAVALSLLLACSLAASAAALGSDTFVAPEPVAVIDTEGGSVSVWSSDFKLIEEANVGAALIRLEPQGFSLPKYTDAPQVSYVLEGHAAVGLITPFGIPTNVRYLTKGDVLVTPAGWAFWAYNCGEKPFRIFGVADTSNGPRTGKYTAFHLVGGKANYTGGILHGFSADVLAAAWDVDEEVVEKLLSAQEKTAIIKVEKKVSLPVESDNSVFGDLVYNLLESRPEFVVEDGGRLSVVTSFKLPILKAVGLSVTHLKLEADAIIAPGWTLNAANIVYVIKGTGRVEIAYPDGHKGLDTKVECGDVVIVPKLFPFTMVAGDEGLEVVAVTTSSTPFASYLAGANAVYKAIPPELALEAFNIDEDLAKEFAKSRQHDVIILPAKEKRSMLQSVTRNLKKQADVAITIRDYLKAEFGL
eukprot:SM000023S07601  [mRNA]  locus=s23:333731:336421:- [translate_table: standard]